MNQNERLGELLRIMQEAPMDRFERIFQELAYEAVRGNLPDAWKPGAPQEAGGSPVTTTQCSSTAKAVGRTFRCGKFYGHTGMHEEANAAQWNDAAPVDSMCGESYSYLRAHVYRCNRPAGHTGQHEENSESGCEYR